MASVSVSGLVHRYGGDAKVLDGIDLEVADGEAHAVLGGSGAGKTTLLNLLSGLLRPSSGRIEFDGRELTGLAAGERNLAQVFQFPVLYPGLDVAGNLGFPLVNRGWRRAAVRQRVGEVAELLDLAPLLRKKPRALSLFEKQMTAIGRALVRPDLALVLLDEPLTAVAPAAKWRLRQALQRVRRELGLTMIYVTHDQTEALTFAERISMLHQGKVLQTGTPKDLYERPAHETVARFIGSPGMNLVPARVSNGELHVDGQSLCACVLADGDCVAGFRPEWARIGDAGIPVSLRSVRPSSAVGGVQTAMVTAEVGGATIQVRQPLAAARKGEARMCIDPERLVLYRHGRLL